MAKRLPKKHTPARTEVVPASAGRHETEESLELILGQLEDRLPQQLSDKHIDRYFDTQQQLYAYIREDHKDDRTLVKDGRRTVIILAIIFGAILLGLLLIIAVTNKQEIDKFLSLFFAFLGGTGVGGGGGVVIGKRLNRNDQ